MYADVQLAYDQMRREGLSHKLAEMFALQAPPHANTDATFLEGHCNGNQFEGQPQMGDFYRREASAAGVDTTGAIYLSALADHPGDPHAWVRSKGDVRRVCEQRGWGCRGAITVKAEEPLCEPEETLIADDIVQDRVAQIMERVPESERPHIDRVELVEQVKDRIAPKWRKA